MSTAIINNEKKVEEKMIRIRLDDILKERKLPLAWLQEQTGIRYASLHDLKENKRDKVNLYHLYAIMNALGITDFNEMFEIEENQDDILV